MILRVATGVILTLGIIYIVNTPKANALSIPTPTLMMLFEPDAMPDWLSIPTDPSTAPIITNLSAIPTSPTTLRVSWKTDAPSDSTVLYATIDQYNAQNAASRYPLPNVVGDSAYTTDHNIVLTNLASDKTYYYEVRSSQYKILETVSSVKSFIVSASTPTQYCSSQSEFFTGIQYENGQPWVEIIVDPAFEAKMKKERKTPSLLPVTPVYDLVVRIKPTFNHYCIPGWIDRNPQAVYAEDLPGSAPVTGVIAVGEKNEAITITTEFSRVAEKDKGSFVYEWKIKGWPDGIGATAELTDLLIEAIGENKPVNLLLQFNASHGEVKEKISFSFSLCAPIWGSGEHKIVGMYGKGSAVPSARVDHFDAIRTDGFVATEPYKKYQSYFSYLVDLKDRVIESFDPTALMRLARKMGDPKLTPIPYTKSIHNKAILDVIGNSTCGNDGILLLTTPAFKVGFGGGFSAGIALANHSTQQAAVIGVGNPSWVYVHELSHTFAGLNDEYIYDFFPNGSDFQLSWTNCSRNPPKDYSYKDNLYGSTKQLGCSFEAGFVVNEDKIGASKKLPYYRPSDDSLMNKGNLPLNIVSCGYVIRAIKGGDAHSYFPECQSLPGIIKEGAGGNPISFVFNYLLSAVKLAQAFPEIPENGDQTENVSASPALIVESFDPNDRWGELYAISGEEDGSDGDPNLGLTKITLSVSKSYYGRIASDDGNIDCGSVCEMEVTPGQSVTLNALPVSNSTFAGWRGGSCSGTGPCRISPTEDVTVSARYRMTFRQANNPSDGGLPDSESNNSGETMRPSDSYLVSLFISVQSWLNSLVAILISLALIVLLWGIILFIKKGDNLEERRNGRNFIIFGIIGIFVMLSIWGIAGLLGNTFGVPQGGTIKTPSVDLN